MVVFGTVHVPIHQIFSNGKQRWRMRTDVQSSALSKSKRMDFLFMAFIYTLIFVTLSYVVFFGSTDFHRTGLVGFLRRKLFSVSVLSFCVALLRLYIAEVKSFFNAKQNYGNQLSLK